MSDSNNTSHKFQNVAEEIIARRRKELDEVKLDLYVDPLDRPFRQPTHVLWDNGDPDESETGKPSDAYIRFFMNPEVYRDEE